MLLPFRLRRLSEAVLQVIAVPVLGILLLSEVGSVLDCYGKRLQNGLIVATSLLELRERLS